VIDGGGGGGGDGGDGGGRDGGGGGGGDGGSGDACFNSGPEVCNGLDDDCDGTPDDSPTDVGGACGTDVGPCTMGTFECQGGELVCGGGAVNPTAESCNGVDDDCDGTDDDGDPGGGILCGDNTGDCLQGVTACVGGVIECAGEIAPVPEECDGRDNDCDGVIDNGNPEGGGACGTGTCLNGTEMCLGGVLQCVGATTPVLEECDGIDNDCDGVIDNGFDFDNDPNHCGDCVTQCTVDNGLAACNMQNCEIAFCFTGYWDDNGLYSDGCEYPCDFAGAEICNGLDDDCDNEIDEGLVPPSICASLGECAGTVAECGGAAGWACNYPASVPLDANGDIIPETDCDDADNDCDGDVDEAFPLKDDPCTAGQGACTTNGTYVCNATDDGVECNAPTPPPPGTMTEDCNGIDDNCNGTIDESAVETDYVAISGGGISGTKYIMRYEASRPNATLTDGGNIQTHACSNPNVIPWTNVTHPQAEAACAAIGARLCSETEWQRACQTSAATACTWSFDTACTTWAPSKCNGNDFDFDPGTAGDQDGLRATSTMTACYANWGSSTNRIHDMSGNVKEWTLQRSANVNPLRGGSYNNTQAGISCTFNFVVADDTFQFANVGFRCCRDTAP
jgi:hypothetical protein